MAIQWDVKITNVDIEKKRADVSFVRTDDLTNQTEYYSFAKAIIGTSAERMALLDLVWAKHLKAVEQQTSVSAFISNLEQLGKSNLEARES